MKYHPVQWSLWTTEARFVAVYAGRRSGKTELAKRRLVRYLPVPKPWKDPRYFFGGPTHDQAKHIAWQDLLDLIPDHWVRGGKHGRDVSYSDLTVKCTFSNPDRQATLHVIGLDKPSRAEGVAWDGGVLDESSDLKPGVFGRSIRPALSDRNGWCWRIGVPKRAGPGAPEFRTFCRDCEDGSYRDGACFTWPSSDILPKEEVEHARETLDPKDFNEQYNARWETAGGQIFHAFDEEYNVRPCMYDQYRPLVVGSDFNVDPMAWVIGHRYANRLEWFKELWMRDANTQATLDRLYDLYSDHEGGFEFYGDAAGQARKTSASFTDYALISNDARFQKLGRTVHYPPKNPAIKDRFGACNAMFCNMAKERRMFIDPSCKHLIQDLETRSYKPGTMEPADKGDVGHITDAMGYAVYKLFPVRLDIGAGESAVIIAR